MSEFNIPLEIIIGLSAGFIALLILVHVSLLVININNLSKHGQLQKEKEIVQPQKAEVDKVLNQLRTLQGTQKALLSILPEQKVLWAQKLNILSDSLPRGVWLRKVHLDEDVFFIEGSAISTDNESIINVHQFTSNLKVQKEFLEHFDDLELGSIQRRKIKQIEIADFMITAKIK